MQDDTSDSSCVVCLDPLSNDHVHTMDSCQHRFHSRCVIQWMQRGNLTCPTCRGDLHDHSQSISSFALMERASYIRRTIGRRTNAPSGLKRLIQKLKDAENRERVHKQERNRFREENKQVLKTSDNMKTKTFILRHKTNQCKRLIGLYATPQHPLPALVVFPRFE